MNRRLAVRTIIFKDDMLLTVRHKNQDTGNVNDYWCSMGGGVDEHEGLIDAVKREVLEETGVKAVVGDLLYVQQFHSDGKDHLEFFFHIKNTEDFENIRLEETTHGEKEIFEFSYINPRAAKILPKFLSDTDIASDIANGKTQFFNYL